MGEKLLTLAEMADLLVSLGADPCDAPPESSATPAEPPIVKSPGGRRPPRRGRR
jgi:hypothetical protein